MGEDHLQPSRVAYSRFDGSGFEFEAPVKAYPGKGCFLGKVLPLLGDNVTRWAENAQLIQIDGVWRVISTARHPDRLIDTGYTRSDEPFIYQIEGEDFSHWIHKRHLLVPQEDWKTVMHTNTAFLLVLYQYGSWFCLFYSGADRLDPDSRGHGRRGVASSRILVNWVEPDD